MIQQAAVGGFRCIGAEAFAPEGIGVQNQNMMSLFRQTCLILFQSFTLYHGAKQPAMGKTFFIYKQHINEFLTQNYYNYSMEKNKNKPHPQGEFDSQATWIEFINEFPQMLGKVVLVESVEGNSDQQEEALRTHLKNPLDFNNMDNHARQDIIEGMSRNEAFTGVVVLPDFVNDYVVIVLPKSSARIQDRMGFPSFLVLPDELKNNRIWSEFILNHEIGHALDIYRGFTASRKGFISDQAEECVADAYALIRHYQKYGKNSTFGQFFADVRAIGLVHGHDRAHYTLKSLDTVTKMAKEGKLEKLTPAQSYDLAVSIMLDTANTWDADRALKTAFEEYYFRSSNERLLQGARSGPYQPDSHDIFLADQVAAIGYQTKIPLVQEACLRYLNALERFLPEQNIDTARQAVEKNSFDHIHPLRKAWDKMRGIAAHQSPKTSPASTLS